MDHADHVELLRRGLDRPGGVWADVGAGTGAFTLALAELLGPGATIHVIDRDSGALRALVRRMAAAFSGTMLHVHRADFTAGLPVDDGSLDGVVMANSLHFIADKRSILECVTRSIRPGGRFLLVEYEADHGNHWVPYPISFGAWQRLAAEAGLTNTKLIGRVPSRFLGAIYAAASRVPSDTLTERHAHGSTMSNRSPVLDSPPHGVDREE
jgi:ubiquinone/menaquinone biosynthesis C-methylase UbiE